jgi:hypothetical protein
MKINNYFVGIITVVSLVKLTFFKKKKKSNKQIEQNKQIEEKKSNDKITEKINYLDEKIKKNNEKIEANNEKIEKLSQVVYDLIETKKPQGGRKRAKINQA